nr:phospholipase-like protein [Tanacetum cinerariifolium]
MGEVDIDTLTIEQYLMLTQENHAQGMVKTKFRGMMKKNIEDMTIAKYIEYENWVLGYEHQSDDSKINAYYDLPPPEEDLDESLKVEMKKRMCGQDKESQDDALIDILKSLVGECKAVYTNKSTRIEASSHGTNEVQGVSFVVDDEEGDILRALPYELPSKELNLGSFTLPRTIGNLNLYDMADLGASVNVMPKSIFEHLKLANLKETYMVVEMADMTKKAPLGIVENILPFLATIHAQIDIFKREISLGIGEDRVKFYMVVGVCHSIIPVEKICMANSIPEDEYFNPFEIKHDVFFYESPACLIFEQWTYDNESVDTLDSTNNIEELEDNHDNVDCGMCLTCNPDLSFCSGYDAIYGKGENGMLEQWMCLRDQDKQSVGGKRMIFADFLKVRYGNKNIDDTTRERRYMSGLHIIASFMITGYTNIKARMSDANTYQNLAPKKNTDPIYQQDRNSNIKTYFPDFPQPQLRKPRPRDYSFEEWLRIKMGLTNVSKFIQNEVLNRWVIDSFDVEIDYGKMRDDPYSRRFDEYKEEFDNEINQLVNEYDLRIGKKGYVLYDVWEKCERFYDTVYPWHEEDLEEEEQWESGIEKTDYKPPFVKN